MTNFLRNLLKSIPKSSKQPSPKSHDPVQEDEKLPDHPSQEQVLKASNTALEEFIHRHPSNLKTIAGKEYLKRNRAEIFHEEKPVSSSQAANTGNNDNNNNSSKESTDTHHQRRRSSSGSRHPPHHDLIYSHHYDRHFEKSKNRNSYQEEIYQLLLKKPTPVPAVINRTSAMCAGTTYVLPDRYRVEKSLGEGSYGTVVKAFDTVLNKHVAVKKIPALFEKDLEYQKRILREVIITKHLRGHDNIVHLKDLPPPVSMKEFQDVYIVLELMGWNLNNLIRSDQEFTEENVQYFIYQILRGLKYIHTAGIVHRDIKPSNILLNSDMDIKICDFGLARVIQFEDEADDEKRTMYVVSRWYRAPELLLMYEKSSFEVDVWSVGCIFAEMLMPKGQRVPLLKGRDYLHQLELTMQLVGSQKDEDLVGCRKGVDFVKRRYSNTPKKSLRTLLPHASADAINLLEGMLQFNPHKRISVDEALKHPFLKACYDGEEPSCDRLHMWYDENLMSGNAKRLMYEEIVGSYHEFQTLAAEELLEDEEE